MSSSPITVWLRRDLRLHDHPALNAAIREGSPVILCYLHCPQEEGTWRRGRASQWWLHHALADLQEQLENQRFALVIRRAERSLDALRELIDETGSHAVYWNRCIDPAIWRRDAKIQAALCESGIKVNVFDDSLLPAPLGVSNQSGKPYQVFTPFWNYCRTLAPSQPETLKLQGPSRIAVAGDTLASLGLLPQILWTQGMADFWNPTRKGGIKLLEMTADKAVDYGTQRDFPAQDGTSRLSPYLHFGQISVREFFHAVTVRCPSKEAADLGMLRQLYWREFATHLLHHFPHSQDSALKPEYDRFPWEFDPVQLRAWQRGATGFPIVDAGMRQLWHTGWMHNRVRMIAGSFLVKHLLQPWQEGARWFWDTLVDADLANNSMGWQWLAGSGADASPYFRVFNPILQGEKFDPDGSYVRRWLPELAKLSNAAIHTPWEAPPMELAAAGIVLGQDYPYPIIFHPQGRQRALTAYQTYKQTVDR